MANKNRAEMTFIPTGIAGLDAVLNGGLLPGGFYLIQGNPGAGKTTAALQFLFSAAKRGERGLYVSLTESQEDLQHVCRSHGWNLNDIQIADLTRSEANLQSESQYSVFHPSEVELSQLTKTIFTEVERIFPHFVVFDGLSEMRLLAEGALRYRHQLMAMKAFFAERGITAILLDDQSNALPSLQPESLVGGNIILDRYLPAYGGERRRLQVTKVRGGTFQDGFHDYDIVEGGIVVYPRLVSADYNINIERRLVTSGLAPLDTLLDGGLDTGTTALFLGPAGVGKSTTAMQFVAQELLKGAKAAVYSFEETLGTLFERTEKLILHGLRQYYESGQLHVQQVNPAQLSPGAFAAEVQRAVQNGAEIVIIDSLNGYNTSMPDEKYLIAHLHELFTYLNQCGVLTLLIVAQHGQVGHMAAEFDVSYLADTVLLLRYFEAEGAIRQAISVFKKRTGGHQRTIHELSITSSGLHIGQPLNNFQGIMTGVPEYRGGSPMAKTPDNGLAEEGAS